MTKRPDSVAKVRRLAVAAATVYDGKLPGDDDDAIELVLAAKGGIVLRDLARAYILDAVKAARRDLALRREQEAQQERMRKIEEDNQRPEVIEERRRREEKHEKAMQEINDRMWASVRAATDKYAAQLKMEWTEELLTTGFALGDGRIVTWGTATIADHQQRIDMLERNAVGNLEAAGRHRAAMEEIAQNGATTLADLHMTTNVA